MNIANYLPVIIRYALVSLATALATRGFLSTEQNAVLTQNIDVLVGALVTLGTVGWALFKRPSAKAMDAAKAIDKQLPKKEDVVIKTPPNMPDIIVPGQK